MTNPELTSNHENNELYDNSLNEELTNTSLGVLKGYISSRKNKESRLTPGQFLALGETKNQNYLKYLYKVETGGTPESIRNKAVSAGLAKSKEGIQVTNAKAIPYGETHRFSAGDEIYIRIPKEQKEPDSENGQFVALGETKNQNYLKYSYKVETGGTPESIRDKAVSAGLAKSKEGIQITNAKAIPYGETHRFSAGDEIYLRIPKLKEASNWNNPDYFDNTKIVETDTQYEDKGIILKRDVGMSFYVMQKSDIKEYREIKNNAGKITDIQGNRVATINHLREKLGALPEFSYLKRDEYAPKKVNKKRTFTQTFNIRSDFAAQTVNFPGKYYIPIPLDSNIRKIEDITFKDYAKSGVEELCKKDEPYGKYWKGLDKSKLARFLTAIAKVETGKTNQQIGTDEYHRWEEGKHDCFSFGPHHVLMEGPGKKAYNNLKNEGYFNTEGQTYHPKNSTMRCMGFIVEKMIDLGHKEKDIKKDIEDMLSFFSKKKVTGEDFRGFAAMYNGSGYASNDYHNKFAKAWNLLK